MLKISISFVDDLTIFASPIVFSAIASEDSFIFILFVT